MKRLNYSMLEPTARGGYSIAKIVPDGHCQMFTIVNYVALCGLVSFCGVLANIINLMVFYRQGLNSTTNIGFFSMAVSDLSCLLLQLWYTVCVSRILEKSSFLIMFTEVLYLTGGVPREAFARITCLITVYITAERCLCIAYPLHVKQMITAKRTAIIILLIYVITWISGLPIYCTSMIDWRFYPSRNQTLLGVVHTSNNDEMEAIVFIIHAIFGSLTFLAVVILTAILAYNIRQQSIWRMSATVHDLTSDLMSKRDRKTMTIVVVIAVVLIICYTPAVALCLTTFFVHDFRRGGIYFNLYYVLWSFALLFENINSSINIFLYLKMSSKYRQTFLEMFTDCSRKCIKLASD